MDPEPYSTLERVDFPETVTTTLAQPIVVYPTLETLTQPTTMLIQMSNGEEAVFINKLPEPTVSWAYKSGTQYPASEKLPRIGSCMSYLLKEFPMLEVFSVDRKRKTYNAYCLTCDRKYSRISAADLKVHFTSTKHIQRASVPPDSDAKEIIRRQVYLKKYSDFVIYNEVDQTLTCKFCLVQLPFQSNKLISHRRTLRHQNAAGVDCPQDKVRLAKLRQAVVREFADVVSTVTETDRQVNESLFEQHKLPEETTLKADDIFCKICYQKITSTGGRYRSAIKSHLRSARHRKEVEAQARNAAIESQKKRPVKMPLRKISTFKHDDEDLKELARVFAEAKLPVSQCDKGLRKVTQAIVHRRVSTPALKRGFQLLNEGEFSQGVCIGLNFTYLFLFAEKRQPGAAY